MTMTGVSGLSAPHVVHDEHTAAVGQKMVHQNEVDRTLIAQSDSVDDAFRLKKLDLRLLDRGRRQRR
jgi:hypothetical protein